MQEKELCLDIYLDCYHRNLKGKISAEKGPFSSSPEQPQGRTICGTWLNLKDTEVTPNPEDSINQLQELYQKGYADAPAAYEFTEQELDTWFCDYVFGSVFGYCEAGSKTKAKKKAAFIALKRLMSGGNEVAN